MTAPIYNGIEVDMLSMGNADALLVTHWSNTDAVRVLIDGGNAGDSEKVLAKLHELRVGHLHHVVCTHPHNDHAAGLIGVLNHKAVTIGQFWMHLPWAHINYGELTASLNRAGQSKVAAIVRASLDTAQQLYHAAVARKIPMAEPFDKSTVGPLYVCGPTVEFYRTLLLDFGDFEKLQAFDTALAAHERTMMMEAFASGLTIGGKGLSEDEGELGSEPTEPENDSSVIMTAVQDGARFLFTADAGVPALQSALSRYDLSNLNWMQIPHHGSRRNLTEELVKYFKPKYAFVSADGSKQHPRRKVGTAFTAAGTKVYGTHYPTPRSLRHHIGVVPERTGYEAATEL
jgi:beta-lactamase superfamily II metal-dependent hydrolase